jgi:hypothetical protein
VAKINNVCWSLFAAAILSSFLSCLGATPAYGAFIKVPDDSTTIQAAISGASAGDTVAVRPSPTGKYAEHIVVGKQLVMLGGWNSTFTARDRTAYATVIDGGNATMNVVKFQPGLEKSTVFDGFRVTGGIAPGATGQRGGGIYCNNCSPTIRNNEIYGNKANFGAGIACLENADADILENYIHDNVEIVSSGLSGCGIYCLRASPYIANNTIEKNKGSGVRLEYSDALVEDNYIALNTHGAGVACLDQSDAVVRNNVLKENRAVFGGGVWIEDSSPLIEFNVFDHNTIEAPSGEGGGAGLSAFGKTGSPDIRNNLFKGNWTTSAGGAMICMGSATPLIEENLFRENNGESAGAILVQENARATIRNNTFYANWSYLGGSLLVTGNAQATVSNNVVYGSPSGGGLVVSQQGVITSICNCVSNNLPSDYIGFSPGLTDISLNPIFCRTDGDTLDLASNSPCLPENNDACSTLVGAFGKGTCGAFPTNLSLVEPLNGAILNNNTPLFRWSDSHDPDGGPVTFEMEYDTQPTFETSVVVPTGQDTSYAIPASAALTEGVTYYWHASATDDEGATTSSDQVWTLLVDLTPPSLTLGVHQHPYLDSYLDFYIVANERLAAGLEASLTVGGVDQDLDMELLDSTKRLYYSSFELTSSGTVQFEALGTDLAGNSTLKDEDFSFEILRPTTGASFASPDGGMRVVVAEGSFSKGAYFLVKNVGDALDAAEALAAGPNPVEQAEAGMLADGSADGRSSIYSITWSPSEPSIPIALKFQDHSPPGTSASICRWTGQYWDPLPTYKDPDTGELFCQTSAQGMFQLRGGSGGGAITQTALLQNFPNPFRSSTTLAFTVAGSGGSLKPVTVAIFDVEGRLIRTLVDTDLAPGPYAVAWDGRDSKGGACPAGLYMYRLHVKGESPIARKMIVAH